MRPDLILAIDQGTHSTRAVIFDAGGQPVALTRQAISLSAHSRTEIEQSPAEILASMQTVLADILRHPDVDPARIQCAGLATQRSSTVAWHKESGAALSPVLSWQDRRSEHLLAPCAAYGEEISNRTGLRLSAHYGAGKISWLLENNEAVTRALEDKTLVVGPLASYLLHHLRENGGELADDANAARTLLWNLEMRDWDPWLLQLFGIHRDILPDCMPICADYGPTRFDGIPLTAVNGDQTAALYARGAPGPDTLIVNIGTGAFVLLPTETTRLQQPGLLSGISMSNTERGDYYLEGTVNGAWAALEWAGKEFNVTGLEEKLPLWLEEAGDPPVFLNTIGGLGAPWWRTGPEPGFTGPLPAAPEAMVAVTESIVFLIQKIASLMQAVHPDIDSIRVSGGLASLDGLCQRLANLSGLPVQRPDEIEVTASGIAWQAAGCPAHWLTAGQGDTFRPCADEPLRRRYARFLDALDDDMQG